MVIRDATAKNGPGNEEADAPPPSYFVDPELAAATGRSLSLLTAGRRCYECQQADEDDGLESSDHEPFVERIGEHCSQTPDYLLPDTPLKEAIFRVLLAADSEPKTPQDISKVLSEKWALTAYPRDVSDTVLQRLLDSSESYCIARVAEPEPEPGDEEGPAPEKDGVDETD
jgi:hypothetical protein